METDYESYESSIKLLLESIQSKSSSELLPEQYSINDISTSMQHIFDALDFLEQNRALIESNTVDEYELIKDLLLHFEDRLTDIRLLVNKALEQRGAADGQ